MISTQETRECLLCLRIPLEKMRKTVEAIFQRWIKPSLDEYDQAVVDRVAERAAKLIASAYEKDRFALCGKSPTCIMAAAIYLSGRMEKGVKISQGMVAKKMNVTNVTIRNRAHQIDNILDLGIMEQRFTRNLTLTHKLYVCPFCEKTFTKLTRLIWHLQEGGWKNTSKLLGRMFNDDGIMVDEDMLKKMKRSPGTCKRPPTVKSKQWREPPIETRGKYIVTG